MTDLVGGCSSYGFTCYLLKKEDLTTKELAKIASLVAVEDIENQKKALKQLENRNCPFKTWMQIYRDTNNNSVRKIASKKMLSIIPSDCNIDGLINYYLECKKVTPVQSEIKKMMQTVICEPQELINLLEKNKDGKIRIILYARLRETLPLLSKEDLRDLQTYDNVLVKKMVSDLR